MFLINLLLALAWTLLTGEHRPLSFAIGFGLGYLALWLVSRAERPSRYFQKPGQVVTFCLFFVWELCSASLRVGYEVATRVHGMRPGIVAIALDIHSDAAITLLANLITLTPGALSLGVSLDRRTLYVHFMHIDDEERVRMTIKNGFERRVLGLFQ